MATPTRRIQEGKRDTRRFFLLFSLILFAVSGTMAAFIVTSLHVHEHGLDLGVFLFDDSKKAALALWTTAIAVAIVAIANWRLRQLQRTGLALATTLDAKLLTPDMAGLSREERRYLDIVEEMAMAAQIPLPYACVMKGEFGINALSAGTADTEPTIVITEGALLHLTRDELTGLVGHETAHLLHQDNRIAIHIMAAAYSLAFLTHAGRLLMQAARSAGPSKYLGPILVLGAVLLMTLGVLGYIGTWFLQTLVAKERETMADAQAARLIGDPTGLALALLKIHDQGPAGAVAHIETMAARHMFAADPTGKLNSTFFSNHPSPYARIADLVPHTDLESLRAMARQNAPSSHTMELMKEAAEKKHHTWKDVRFRFGIATLLLFFSEGGNTFVLPGTSWWTVLEAIPSLIQTIMLARQENNITELVSLVSLGAYIFSEVGFYYALFCFFLGVRSVWSIMLLGDPRPLQKPSGWTRTHWDTKAVVDNMHFAFLMVCAAGYTWLYIIEQDQLFQRPFYTFFLQYPTTFCLSILLLLSVCFYTARVFRGSSSRAEQNPASDAKTYEGKEIGRNTTENIIIFFYTVFGGMFLVASSILDPRPPYNTEQFEQKMILNLILIVYLIFLFAKPKKSKGDCNETPKTETTPSRGKQAASEPPSHPASFDDTPDPPPSDAKHIVLDAPASDSPPSFLVGVDQAHPFYVVDTTRAQDQDATSKKDGPVP